MAKPPAEVDLLSSALLDATLARPVERAEPLIPTSSLWFLAIIPPLILVMDPAVFSATPAEIVVRLIANAVVTLAIGTALWVAYGRLLPRAFVTVTGSTARLGLQAAAVVVAVIFGLALFAPFQPMLCGKHPLEASLSDWLPSFYLSIVVATGFVWIARSYERLRVQAREVEAREQDARNAALAAQLAALSARTNPHFFFNSLNAVASLIQEDPDRAERMVERLSDLFRYTLDGSRRRYVPLREEVEMVRDYLDIEGIRLGDRLTWTVEIGDGVGDVEVPPLVLQPIVENAVRHGVSGRREGGRVEVRVQRDAGELLVAVTDDGPGPGGSKHSGSGTSMRDLKKRLAIVYGERARIDARAAEGGGYRVELRVPATRGDA